MTLVSDRRIKLQTDLLGNIEDDVEHQLKTHKMYSHPLQPTWDLLHPSFASYYQFISKHMYVNRDWLSSPVIYEWPGGA